MVVVTVGGESYYMHDKLKAKWDALKDGKLAKSDEDRVYIVDGRERSGKSVWVLQQAAYIDPTIIEGNLDRIVYSNRDTLHAIRNTKSNKNETKVIIADEAFRNVSSTGGLSKENKAIKQALMEMGQNNLVLFLVAPSFFLLELYASVLRSEALFHIQKAKNEKRRMFKVYNHNKKGDLYRVGVRKGWKYSQTRFKGNFFNKYPGGKAFETLYRQRKWEALRDTVEKEEMEPKFKIQRDKLLCVIRKKLDLTIDKTSEWISPSVDIKKTVMSEIFRKYPDISGIRTPIV